MKKWIVCKYGEYHVQSPYRCVPVGVAYQKQMGDSEETKGFCDMDKFEKWLKKNDLCAFGDVFEEDLCKYGLRGGNVNDLPVVYSRSKEG